MQNIIEEYNKILNEKFVTRKSLSFDKSAQFEIFVNPTSKEWKEIGYWARGLIDSDGDIYVSEGPDGVIHDDILDALKIKYYEDIHDDWIFVIRNKNSNEFYLADDHYGFITMSEKDDYYAIYMKIEKKFKAKNPNLKIVWKTIQSTIYY